MILKFMILKKQAAALRILFCLSCVFSFSSYGISGRQAADLLLEEFGGRHRLYERPLSILSSESSSGELRRQAARDLESLPSPWETESLARLLRVAGLPFLSPGVFLTVAETARRELQKAPQPSNIQMETLDLIQTLTDGLPAASQPGKKPAGQAAAAPKNLQKAYAGWPGKLLSALTATISYPLEQPAVALKAAALLSRPQTPVSIHEQLQRLIVWGKKDRVSGLASDIDIMGKLLAALVSDTLSSSVRDQIISIFDKESDFDAFKKGAPAELFVAAQWALFAQLRRDISPKSSKTIIRVLKKAAKEREPLDQKYAKEAIAAGGWDEAFAVPHDWEKYLLDYLENRVVDDRSPAADRPDCVREEGARCLSRAEVAARFRIISTAVVASITFSLGFFSEVSGEARLAAGLFTAGFSSFFWLGIMNPSDWLFSPFADLRKDNNLDYEAEKRTGIKRENQPDYLQSAGNDCRNHFTRFSADI